MKKYIRDAVPIESLEVPLLGVVTKGLKVKHPLFGPGTVVELFRFPDGKHSLRVEFETHGSKALAPEYAKLEPIK